MSTISMKAEEVRRQWYIADANDQVLGRFATEIARRLRGKHEPEFTPHVDCGDYIVVINAEKVRVTGQKPRQKIYNWHSGYTGGIKAATFTEMQAKNPIYIIEKAVKGMLPKGPLGRAMLRKLKVYVGNEHPHAAQQPEILKISEA